MRSNAFWMYRMQRLARTLATSSHVNRSEAPREAIAHLRQSCDRVLRSLEARPNSVPRLQVSRTHPPSMVECLMTGAEGL